MWGPNTYEWILIQFATAKAGIILVSQSGSIMLKEMFILLNIVPMLTLAAYSQLVNKYLLISSRNSKVWTQTHIQQAEQVSFLSFRQHCKVT